MAEGFRFTGRTRSVTHPLGGYLATAFGVLGIMIWIARWLTPGLKAKRRRRRDAELLLGRERLAMVAHEFRTPLGAIRHAMAILESASDARPQVRAACAIVRRQLEQAGRLVDDLLVPSEGRGACLGVGLEPLDLAAVVADAVQALRGPVEERGHQLTVSVPREPLVIRGDGQRLAQVVTNLVWNAAKFTPAGGHIVVTLAREDDEAIIRVRDDGIGLTPAMRGRIFRLFTRAAPAGDGGRGIGLTVVELILARHGGTITAHSDGPGCGSEFVVRLPGPAGFTTVAGERHKVCGL